MSCSIAAVGRFDISDNAATVSSKRPFEANSCSLPAVRWPARCIDSTRTSRGRITQRLSCDGSLDAARDFVDDTVNVGFAYSRSTTSAARTFADAAVSRRSVVVADRTQSHAVSASSPWERLTSVSKLFTENLAPCSGRAQHDLLVAAFDKNLGKGFRQRAFRRRNGEQMLLVLGARAFDQRFGVECFPPVRIEATSIASSQASTRRICGAIGTGPRRIERSA